MESKILYKVENIQKSFGKHKVLIDFNCTIFEKDFVLLRGSSGSGKSTLLNIIGLLDTPDEGILYYEGEQVKPFTKKATSMLRYEIGYLFQSFALMEDEKVEANLKIALTYSDKGSQDIDTALQRVGLASDIKNKFVKECSGGEQQRIAMARLLLKPCTVILADEPTGSLDVDNRNIIIGLLKELNDDGKTIIVASHDPVFQQVANKNIIL